jgi:hypothetical protein
MAVGEEGGGDVGGGEVTSMAVGEEGGGDAGGGDVTTMALGEESNAAPEFGGAGGKLEHLLDLFIRDFGR